MLYILYSDDYEVFLGGNHRPESEVLVDTTERVLEACEEIAVPMTLFADVACLWRYRELGHSEFPQMVEEQLCGALRRGHDVQAHLHPHWAEAQIQHDPQGRSHYLYDLSRFLLGNCASEAGGGLYGLALDLLKRAKGHLTDFLRPVDPLYRCVAFRAGGWGIQPGTKAILAALEDAGFLIDSSVVPGFRVQSNVNRVDFTDVPREANYYLSRELGLSSAASTGVFEIPVAAGPLGRAAWATAKARKLARTLTGKPGQSSLGYSIQSTRDRSDRGFLARVGRLAARWPRRWAKLQLSDDAGLMLAITRSYVDRFRSTPGDLYFAFVCHSKTASPPQLKALKQYHRSLWRLYGQSIRAITFQEATLRKCQAGSGQA
jgi:hypothetical protein